MAGKDATKVRNARKGRLGVLLVVLALVAAGLFIGLRPAPAPGAVITLESQIASVAGLGPGVQWVIGNDSIRTVRSSGHETEVPLTRSERGELEDLTAAFLSARRAEARAVCTDSSSRTVTVTWIISRASTVTHCGQPTPATDALFEAAAELATS